jgi:transposase
VTRKDRQRFSREFKLEAVRLANESGKLATEVARELGVSVQALYKWQDEVAKRGGSAFPGSGRNGHQNASPQDDLSKLKRENAQLREERDILKKAITFFVKEK